MKIVFGISEADVAKLKLAVEAIQAVIGESVTDTKKNKKKGWPKGKKRGPRKHKANGETSLVEIQQ